MPALPAVHRVGDLLASTRRYDQRNIVQILDACEVDLGLGQTLDDVVLPTLRVVGTLWAGGALDIAHEHCLTVALRHWVAARIARYPCLQTSGGGLVVLTVGPDNQHTFSLDCLELLLTARGVPVLNLAVELPLDTLQVLCSALQPTAVVVVAHNPTTATRSVHTTRTLNEDGWHVYYAGAAFNSLAVRTHACGTPLDHTLTAAADHLNRTTKALVTVP